jgi:2-C-methyl-D-erythritol 4-phosphate cytidylyltransferase
MRSKRPKQYLQIAGKSILQYSVEALCQHPSIAGVMLAVDFDDPDCPRWQEIHGKPICKCPGGATRAHSVGNALQMLQQMQLAADTLIAVHDGARPCLSQSDLSAVLNAAANRQTETTGAILALPMRDTIKLAGRNDADYASISQTLDRSVLWAALTPQVFPLQALISALQQFPGATDEAQAMEQAGFAVRLVVGSVRNLKVTVPEDLKLAQFWLQGN